MYNVEFVVGEAVFDLFLFNSSSLAFLTIGMGITNNSVIS